MQPNNDQNPEQPQQPQAPTQDQPASGSSMGRTLQPLSSEDSIRIEAQAAQPQPQAQQSTAEGDSTASPTVLNSANNYTSNLATEPIQRQPQGAVPNPRATPSEPSSSKSGSNKIIPIIIGLVVVAVLGAGLYYFFFSHKIASADLIESTVSKTSYKHPKDWKSIPLGFGKETYADLGDNKPATRIVSVDESIGFQYYGDNRPDNWYEEIRSQAMAKETVGKIRMAFTNGGKDCTSDIAFNVESDTKTGNKTVGLALATGSCTREDGTYVVKRRTVTGEDDGLFRHITVGALESDWSKNKALFDAMLDSVRPAGVSA